MIIKFRPVTKITHMVNGRRIVLFHPKYVYKGILNSEDRTVSGYNSIHDIYLDIKLNDYMIEEE